MSREVGKRLDKGRKVERKNGERRNSAKAFASGCLIDRAYKSVLGKKPITAEESNELLLFGNQGFVEQIRGRETNLARLSEIDPYELWLVCSDARAGVMIDLPTQLVNRVAIVFSAGNVFSPNQPASNTIFRTLLDRMDDKAIIRIIGHVGCGAVKCADEGIKASLPPHLRALLNEVTAGHGGANATDQFMKLQTLQTILKRSFGYSVFVFDWNSASSIPVSQDSTIQMMRNAFKIRSVAGYVRGMNTQYAHAVLVSSVTDELPIPVDPRAVFGINSSNEAFCVTANSVLTTAPAFDAISLGSILYSLMNNQTNNVVLVHPDTTILRAWKKELHNWFGYLLDSSDAREVEVGARYLGKEIAITIMQFDMNTGKVHLAE